MKNDNKGSKEWTLDRMAWISKLINMMNGEYCKHDPEKDDHDPEKSHWNEANGPEWP